MLGRDCKEGHNQICSSVEKLEKEISKIKKNAEDLGTTLKTKCNDFRNKLDEIEVNEELSEDVIEKLVNLREFLSFSERKPDKGEGIHLLPQKTLPNPPKYVVAVIGVFCHLKL